MTHRIMGPELRADALAAIPPTGLCFIRRKLQASKNAVVFVHGYRGHIVDTWGAFPQLQWDDNRLDEWDLAFFGYDTAALSSILRTPFARKVRFEDKAVELADALRAYASNAEPKLVSF